MTTDRCRRIAIIGAGFSGTALTINLLRRSKEPTEILLIDRSGVFGLGLAYATPNPAHILNVDAAKMSLVTDDPDHFVSWLHETGRARDGDVGHAFLPRPDYGQYLQSSLRTALAAAPAGVRVQLVAGHVTTLTATGDGVTLVLSDGRKLIADDAVLCLGNPEPSLPPWHSGSAFLAEHIIDNPWSPGILQKIAPDHRVVLIGTGLTMVDIVIELTGRGHRGALQAISRHGLMPQSHATTRSYALDRLDIPTSMLGQLRWLRAHIAKAAKRGIDWRGVIDAMRPHIQKFWTVLPQAERKRFIRHCRAYWDIHRHRTAPMVAARIETLLQSGKLSIAAGRILKIETSAAGMALSIAPRGGHASIAIEADWVLNCTGPTSLYGKLRDDLVQHLLDTGAARLDPLGMGFDIDADCRLMTRDGRPAPRLYALGPPTRGILWEITAVPDIRSQCAALAETLAHATLS